MGKPVFPLPLFQKREKKKNKEKKLTRKNGIVFFLASDKPYFNLHVDLVRFNSQGKIAQLRQFFDTRHLHDHVEEHHGKSKEGEGK